MFEAALLLAAVSTQRVAVNIPSRFIADRVYVELPVGRGHLRLYTDSGGGSLILSSAAAKRLHLNVTPIDNPEAKAELGPNASTVQPPPLAPPLPPLPRRAFVTQRAAQIPSWPEQGDGFVGAKWFEGGVWSWDYVHHQLRLEGSGWRAPSRASSAPIHFQTDERASRPTNFARIDVMIDGRQTPMLLDTGAETFLTGSALSRLRDHRPRMRATSMLQASDFDSLHLRHPDWPFLAGAQQTTNAAMLRVPSIQIAGLRTGPVWFTRRSNDAYRKFMSSMMDAPVEGSLGGNALHSMIMTIDYPNAVAYFEQVPR